MRRIRPGTRYKRTGVGVHTAAASQVTIGPIDFGAGIVINGVPATLVNATSVPGATRVGEVLTPEHLLAALLASGVTDARVTVSGPEVPILDGSALPFLPPALEPGPRLLPRTVTEVTRVEDGASWAELRPAELLTVTVSVDFDDPNLPRGTLSRKVGRHTDLLAARTFVLARDVERLRASGRGRGASIENTLVVRDRTGQDTVLAHKWVDAVGDLALAGPLVAHLVVHRGSHSLHQAVLRDESSVRRDVRVG